MTLYKAAERRPAFARVGVVLNNCIDNAEPEETVAVRFLRFGKLPENLKLMVKSVLEPLQVHR